ncbi:methyltransferase domain-containing protein [archaeon]|nr:MAG: methyltransferase domain-containing protein [archaeon]
MAQYRDDWDSVMFRDNDSVAIKVGQRLGVPFTRSMQEKVDIKLTIPPSPSDTDTSNPPHSNQHRVLSVFQDQAGLTAISGVVWDCALLFTDYILQTCACRTEDDGMCILDIGCGTGVCGLVALHTHPKCSVMFTDRYLSHSLENNLDTLDAHAKTRCEFCEYDWSSPSSYPPFLIVERHYDLVCCSDVLYDKAYHTHLLHMLASLSYTKMVFAYKKRHPVEERKFFQQLSLACKLCVLDPDTLCKVNVTEDMARSGLYIVVAEKIV